MPYASQSDMVARFGEREVRILTDRDNQGLIDPAVLDYALAQADAEIDGYLQGRFALPLASVPVLLVGIACDVARYRLAGTDIRETDPIRMRYKDAVKLLASIGKGELQLGLSATGQATPDAGAVRIVEGGRVFTPDTLSDY
jgi:phage gp36-like protein